MMAIRSACALAVGGIALVFAAAAVGQDTPRWSDIDCAQSRLSAPPGLQCKSTQNYAGGDSSTGTAGGTFRRWLASGQLNGAGVFYYLAEATSLGASMMEGSSLQKDIRNEMKDGNMIHEFSPMGNRGGADYMTFTSGSGNSCVGIRRYGPSQGEGYKWILYGVSCDPRGRPITDTQIDGFIAGASYRGS